MIKPFRTIDEQIEILEKRGLIISDKESAGKNLMALNYYRLSGYTLSLRKNDVFYPNITFENVLEIYYFDHELKLLLLKYLEEIEISLRTHIAYEMGKLGGDSYLKSDSFISTEHCTQFSKEILAALSDCKNEAFVKHHKTSYNGILPVWALVETLSFGSLSRLFEALNVTTKKNICSTYYDGIRYTYIQQWLHSLVVVRNLCAHHSRLYNRGIPLTPPFGEEDKNLFKSNGYDESAIGKRIFFHILILCRLAKDKNCENELIQEICKLKKKYPFVDLKHYGFKHNWQDILRESNRDYRSPLNKDA